MGSVASPGSAREALGMLRSAMGYLAAADATAMAAETQAQCLRMLEQVNSMGTAARASILAAFTAGQGYSADADYSPRAWLIHKTGVTKGTAVGYTAWVRRAGAGGPGRAVRGDHQRSQADEAAEDAGEPGQDNDETFADRALRLVTTFGGAGVLHGDLTPECAAAVGAVLDALSGPAGPEDTRTREQRCHDALQEAMR